MPLPSLSLLLRRGATAALVPLVAGAALAATAAPAQAVDTGSPVVISEVYGGGGNSGAPFRNDFIELYNSGTTTVDLSSWSVQYASSSGTSYALTKLVGTVAPGAFYLVQEGAGANTAAPPLPTPDAAGSIAMSGTAGKVALVKNQTALTCGSDCDGAADVVDFVGFGSATDFAGSGLRPARATPRPTSAPRRPRPTPGTTPRTSRWPRRPPRPRRLPPRTRAPRPRCRPSPRRAR